MDVAIEIDQQIATGDQVQFGEGRVFEQIMGCKEDTITQALIDAIAAPFPAEKTSQPLGRDVVGDCLWVQPGAPTQQGRLTEIGGKDLDGDRRIESARLFQQQDR